MNRRIESRQLLRERQLGLTKRLERRTWSPQIIAFPDSETHVSAAFTLAAARWTKSLFESCKREPRTESLLGLERRIIGGQVVPMLDQLAVVEGDHDDG